MILLSFLVNPLPGNSRATTQDRIVQTKHPNKANDRLTCIRSETTLLSSAMGRAHKFPAGRIVIVHGPALGSQIHQQTVQVPASMGRSRTHQALGTEQVRSRCLSTSPVGINIEQGLWISSNHVIVGNKSILKRRDGLCMTSYIWPWEEWHTMLPW